MKFLVLIFSFLLTVQDISGQTLPLEEVITSCKKKQEDLSNFLTKKGWSNYNFETKNDSNFNRRVWVIENPYSDLKSYYIHYGYFIDTTENHTIYQFSDRPAFNAYHETLKSMGFKSNKPKSKKKNKKDKDQHKEIEDIYYSEKHNSVIVLKDVFFYGMNTFLVYSYKYNSAIGKNVTIKK